MTAIRLAVAALVLVLLLGAGVWYYLFGPNKVAAADLVPSDTIAFATIPNAARIVADYQTSQLKKLVNAPEAQPLVDSLSHQIGPKNLELLQSFLPSLSGQSFLAVTHFDPAHPASIGLIGGLKPKPGAGNFTDFIAKCKDAYPRLLAQGTTGTDQVEGLDYQWIKGPGASDKICVAQYNGWIITAWGEDTLRDWWERWQKKSATPSLTQNASYQKSLQRVGIDSEAIVYLDYHAIMGLIETQMAKANPATGQYLTRRTAGIGAFSIGTKFEHGEIADHFSFLMPKEAQLAAGMSAGPCAFDTLKFTGPDTRFYWGSSFNFSRAWSNFQEQAAAASATAPGAGGWVNSVKNWAQEKNLDMQRNIIGPLGDEFSLQAEWAADSSYPEVGLFVKLDKPDDFKPTIAAIIDTVRQTYPTTAVINEINSDGQNFATLKFIQALPVSPTITEDGPYLGVFLTENQAVRSFKRDTSVGLLNNDSFKAQIGDRQKTASQMIFVDSPQLIDRGYQTALPYVSIAAMFNRTLGGLLQGRTLPPDLQWLAPIETWTFESSADDDGITAYSVSGIGNQGIFLSSGLGGGFAAVQMLYHPAMTARLLPSPVIPPPAPLPATSPTPLAAPPIPANPVPAAAPVDTTNAAPAAIPPPAAVSVPDVSNSKPVSPMPPAVQPAITNGPSVLPPDASSAAAPAITNVPPAAPAPTTNQ